ncbi:MAG: SAM-dependent methyltransferase [Bacteroidota bacterium]|nr:SAM-dependent methyltransferase [Bacteroidota bacterium]
MATTDLEAFLNHFTESTTLNRFIKLTLSKKRNEANELKNAFIKPVIIKAGLRFSFVYRYPTKDVTKNYDLNETLLLLRAMMNSDFYKADLFTSAKDFHLTINKNGKSVLLQKAAATVEAAVATHDHEKKRLVGAENNVYLQQLGITTADGKVKSDKQDKYRQINKNVEIIESIVKEADLPANVKVADMGAGKGYLTFALYDYLANTLKLQPEVTGVELRQELVDSCNKIAAEAGFEKLHFQAGAIETTDIPADVLIALHACDIATDQAIYRGIKGNAKVIICAPCCHKQIRKQMHPTNGLKAISRFGILEERQAEILTDTIRALILEAFGYKTKVFEFISTEHTPKNVMIVGIKIGTDSLPKKEIVEQIKSLKALFNIEYHHLEKLMEI